MNLAYVLSLPERIFRALAASLGGLIYELSQILVPAWFRGSRIYQVLIARVLRITIELIGGVKGALPADDLTIKELAMRKVAGNVVELASFLAVGWSPLWLLAAAADLTGGTRVYLRALVKELQKEGLLSQDEEIHSVEELLDTLENTSSQVAETIDLPPLNVVDMRRSWQGLKGQAGKLPNPENLSTIYEQLRRVAKREDQTLSQTSALLAAGAMRAGIQVGQTYIFEYYHNSLRTINNEGINAYVRRVSGPYRLAVVDQFDPMHKTSTERFLGWFGNDY
jgi:hypothetical protein